MFNFNFWFLLVPLYAVIAFMFGTMKYRVSPKDKIVSFIKTDTRLNMVSVVLSLALQISIIAESIHGLLQIAINSLAETELGWLPFVLAIILLTSFGIFFVFFFYSGKLGEIAMYHLLQLLIERKKRNEKMADFMPPIEAH